MTKAELFRKAHQLAKTFTGDYRARFSLALVELTGIVKVGHIYTEGVKEMSEVITESIYLKKDEIIAVIEAVKTQFEKDENSDVFFTEVIAPIRRKTRSNDGFTEYKLDLVKTFAPNISKKSFDFWKTLLVKELDLIDRSYILYFM